MRFTTFNNPVFGDPTVDENVVGIMLEGKNTVITSVVVPTRYADDVESTLYVLAKRVAEGDV